MQGWEIEINTLSVRRPQPIEWEKRKGKKTKLKGILVLSMIVGMLSQPTLLAFFKFVMILVFSRIDVW